MDRSDCCRQLGWHPSEFHVVFPFNTGDPVKRPGLAAEAVSQLRRQGTQVHLHMLRGVAHHHVPVWLNAADVVLITSRQEGSPNVVKEALACNRSVVAVRVGDLVERIGGVEGCHLAEPTPEDLAQKMERVRAGSGSSLGREAVHSLCNRRIAQQLLAFYETTRLRWQHGQPETALATTAALANPVAEPPR